MTRFSWRAVGSLTRATDDELDILDALLVAQVEDGMALTMSVSTVEKPREDIERVILARLGLDTWVGIITRGPQEWRVDAQTVLVCQSDEPWMQHLRGLVAEAQKATLPAAMDARHSDIEDFEAQVLQEARNHIARATALLALLLQDSEDAEDELDTLQGVVAGAADLQIAALRKALHKRRIEA